MCITDSWRGSTHAIGAQRQKQFMPLLAIGAMITIGGGLPGPPLYLIPHLIRHAEVTKVRGTLVITQWPLAPFWPMLFPDRSHALKCIQQVVELPKSQDLFSQGAIFSRVSQLWQS